MFAMAAAIALRSDVTGPDLRRLARRTQDAKQARRLLALATIYDGGSRSDAARIGRWLADHPGLGAADSTRQDRMV
jgi:hypothetical protein